MKTLFFALMVFFPSIICGQQDWYNSSPLDYMWKNVGKPGFSPGEAKYISLAISPAGEPYVAFIDNANSGKAAVMKFNGTTWVSVGPAVFSTGMAYGISLVFSPSGEPYVAYADIASSENVVVMKFNGTTWVNIGNAGFPADSGLPSLAFSPSGQPYVAFEESWYGISVMKFNGTNWSLVGPPNFTGYAASDIKIAFSPLSGQPHVVYKDLALSPAGATVQKFNGTYWEFVGPKGLTVGEVWSPCLAFSPSGDPYLAYIDNGTGQKATVSKFIGDTWQYVGPAGFSPGFAYKISLAFNQNGQPYVAFYSFYGGITVMKFNGNNWVEVGPPVIEASQVDYLNLAFSQHGTPYIAFQASENAKKATVMKYDSVYYGMDEQQEPYLSVSPNPASNFLTVLTPGVVKEGFLSVLNIEGQELIQCHLVRPKTQLEISTLRNGIYFVRLTVDRTVQVRKFIKQ
jgi:hypothetical protein